jgi:hypothetical protein
VEVEENHLLLVILILQLIYPTTKLIFGTNFIILQGHSKIKNIPWKSSKKSGKTTANQLKSSVESTIINCPIPLIFFETMRWIEEKGTYDFI